MVDAAGLVPEFGLSQDIVGSKFEDHKQFPYPPIHIRYQQRTGRKGYTVIEGIPDDIDLKLVLKAMKKQFACNGFVIDDNQKGLIIQLQGTQGITSKQFLISQYIAKEDTVFLHGF